MSSEDISRELARLVGTLSALGKTIEERPRSTLIPHDRDSDTAGRRAMALLTELARSVQSSSGRSLTLEGTLGQGGMGIVRLATQETLGRKVAVKALKDEHRNEKNTLELLREAWVTGALEHPNVVPVYDIALDEHGSPLILLKRIGGLSWADLLASSASVQERFGARDPLEWHLRILLQVCNAVHFAHSRGVIHRDLKPENVMIGEFGEVYLVDWGIAVSLEDDKSGRLPLASSATGIAGTPAYLAPEMLDAVGSRLTKRTDVYLLGAVLHEIVTGRAPHEGENFMAIVQSVVLSKPELGADVPRELARIVTCAMSRDPDERFESVEAFRAALDDYLTHRGSAHIAAEAQKRLTELERELARTDVERREHDERLYRLFGECRFGFRAALGSWPDNVAASDGLRRAIELMIDHELDGGDPRAANTLLSELAPTPEGLRARVDAKLREKAVAQQKLERMQRDMDPSVGRRTRLFLGVVFGVMWTGAPLAAGLLAYEATREVNLAIPLAMVALTLAAGLWARESLTKTKFNRRMQGASVLTLSLQFVLHLTGLVADVPIQTVELMQIALWLSTASMLSLLVDKRIAPGALAYAIALFVTALRPEWRYFAMTGGNFGLIATLVWLWRPNASS